MPDSSSWKFQKLESLCSRIGDGLHGTPNYVEKSDYAFINGNNLKQGSIEIEDDTKRVSKEEYESNLIKLNKNSLLIGINGTLGNMAFYKGEKVMLGKSSAYLNFNSEINKFYYYYFQIPGVQKYFYRVATGSTIKNLSLRSLQEFEVPVPPENEWRQIANVLSTLDAKIELNNKINAELEAMAKLVYDYWFVQFDFPTSAAYAASVGKPLLAGQPYKSSGGKMEYNEELKREIPEGWEVNELGEVINTNLGGTPSTKKEEYWNGSIPWLNSGEIANFPIIDSELKTTELGVQNSATSLLPIGTVMLSITRHLRASILAVDACANQSVVGLCENENIKSSFLYPYLVNDIPRLMTLRTGAQQPHINKGIVDSSPIVCPSNDVLESYYSKVDSLYKKITNGAFQNQELASLRDWLLPMLMNGQVTVGDAEEKVAAYSASGEVSLAAEGEGEYRKGGVDE